MDGHPLIVANRELTQQGLGFVRHVQGFEGLYALKLPPYGASIGQQVRHVLDLYDCLLRSSSVVDLTARERNEQTEVDPTHALVRLRSLDDMLRIIGQETSEPLELVDDVGVRITTRSTIGEGLRYVFVHTTHHYAQMNTMLALAAALHPEEDILPYPDLSFGYNPSTIKANNVHID